MTPTGSGAARAAGLLLAGLLIACGGQPAEAPLTSFRSTPAPGVALPAQPTNGRSPASAPACPKEAAALCSVALAGGTLLATPVPAPTRAGPGAAPGSGAAGAPGSAAPAAGSLPLPEASAPPGSSGGGDGAAPAPSGGRPGGIAPPRPAGPPLPPAAGAGPPQPPAAARPAAAAASRPQPTATTAASRPLLPVVDRGSYVPPIVRNGTRKWGLGVYRDSNRVADLLRQTQPGVILLMDPTIGWAKRVRAANPDAFIVGRRFRPDSEQRLDRPEERGVAFADWVAELAVPLRGVVDGWVSYNEPVGSPDGAAYAEYNRFQVAFARRLQYTYGVAAVAGNDGPAALRPEDYPGYFAEAIAESEFLGLHIYAASRRPAMRWDPEWHALRYRKVHEALERAGIRGKRIVITESGLADGHRADGLTDEETAEGLAWFTRELQRDPYVIGHATFGLFDATGAWPQHDLTDSAVPELVPRLLDRLP